MPQKLLKPKVLRGMVARSNRLWEVVSGHECRARFGETFPVFTISFERVGSCLWYEKMGVEEPSEDEDKEEHIPSYLVPRRLRL